MTAMPLDLRPRWRLPSDLGYGPDNPPDKYILGDVWVTRHREGLCDEYIAVSGEPSPYLLIGDELLRALHYDSRNYNVCAWVDLTDPEYEVHADPGCPGCMSVADATPDPMAVCFTGTMFHVNARNQHLLYRVGNYRPRSRTWEAAWPD